jgi:hypothetical protein
MSSRYDVPKMVGSECSATSPSVPFPLSAGFDDHDPSRWHTTENEPDDYLHDVSLADHQ